MSTKTSFKRIALVAASALAIAGFSAVPANAAETAAGVISSINLKAATANTNIIGSNVDIFFGGAKTAAGIADNDESTFAAAITAYPTGGFVSASGVGSAATLSFTDTTTVDTATGSTVLLEHGTNAGADSANTVTATGTDGLGLFRFVPTVAGVYTVTVWHDAATLGSIQLTEAQQTISITVVAASAFSAGTSSAYLIAGNTNAAVGTVVTNAAGASGSKTMSIANVAAITVSLNNAENAAMVSGNTITATITGSGGVGGSTANAPATNQCSATTVVRSIAVTADAVNTIYVCADGSAGVGTVTISVTNAAGATVVLATRTVTFYGSITALTLVGTPLSVLRAGGFQSGAITALTGATAALSAAVVLKATDSGGNLVLGLSTIAGVSSSTSIIASSAVDEDTVANDANSIYGGPGYYVAHVTSATSSASGNTATVTYRILNPADGVTYLTAVATFTVGGSVASEILSFDKTSYSPGGPVVLTRTAKDSAGNPVYDGAASPAVTFNKSVGGTAPGASFYVGGKKATSATAPTLFAPVSTGDFMALATSGNAAATALTASSTVEGDTAAADAASLALDAANAATDAANNAYDEAQNATQAASDALAAVTALATQVESLIAAVKKLTAAVAKLKKKK